jgi:hypothetical protein
MLLAALFFLFLTNWLFSELLAFLPLQLFDVLGYGLGWIVLVGVFLLGSWFFGE